MNVLHKILKLLFQLILIFLEPIGIQAIFTNPLGIILFAGS